MKESSSESAKTRCGGGKSEREADGMGKSEKRGKRPGERYSTLYREISIMRICNFNASPNPAKLPKRKPAASTLRANPEHRGSSLVHPLPLTRSLRRSSPGFPRSSPLFTPARPPSPLSPPSRNPITPRATSYVQQPNPHTRTRRASLPRDQIDSVRVSSSRLLFPDFFAIVEALFYHLIASLSRQVGTGRIN